MRILLFIEQQVLIRKLQCCLAEESLTLDTVLDAGEGDCKVCSGRYDAVLLDEAFDGIDVLECLARWRREATDVSLLVLGEGETGAGVVPCLDAGADDYLPRPFQIRELAARLRAVLRRRRRLPNPRLTTHDLEIDTVNRVVRRAGREIRLTRREYALLEFLALHVGQVVTRNMIWEHLYDERDESTSNVVDVYIRYLRTKIDRGFDPPLILTRWGQGYLLRAEEQESKRPRRQRSARAS